MFSTWRGLPLSIAAAALAVSLGAATPAMAASALPAPMVIVIDYTEVIRDSTAGKAVLAKRDELMQAFQAEFAGEEQKLRNEEKSLTESQPTSAEQAKQKQERYRALQQKAQNLQRAAQEKRRAIDEAFNKAMTVLQQGLVKVVDEIATEQGANLVLLKSQVFLHEPKFEITKTAVERLNQRVPSIEFPTPAATPAAAPAKPAAKPATKK